MTQLVTFPGLGLSFDLDRVAFQLFGNSVYWYGIIIASGFLLAVMLCCRWAPRYGLNSDQIFDYLIFAVPAALVGARTYYVLFYLDLFRRSDGSYDWMAMLQVRDGGLAIYGAVIVVAIVLVIYCKKKALDFFAFADLGVQGLLIGQLVGRWGNFMNVEAYGGLTALPWRMCSESIAGEMFAKGYATAQQYQQILDGTLGVHPTFFYESAWNLIGLVLLYLVGRYARKFDGQLFWGYLLWYGVGRFWIEGLRTDSLYFFGLEFFGHPVRTSQMLALGSALVGAAMLVWKWRQPQRPLFVDRMKVRQEREDAGEDPDDGKE